MKINYKLILLLSVSIGISACSWKRASEDPGAEYLNGNGVQVDLMRDQAFNPRSVSLGAVTQRTSDGSVEIYSLDGNQTHSTANARAPIMQRSSVINQANEAPFTPESGLEIFPLDKKMNQALRLPK